MLELAASALPRFAKAAKSSGKTLSTVADGAYAKRPFLKPLRAAGLTFVSRPRKDAAWSRPSWPSTGRLSDGPRGKALPERGLRQGM
jgi:hypothetical protein